MKYQDLASDLEGSNREQDHYNNVQWTPAYQVTFKTSPSSLIRGVARMLWNFLKWPEFTFQRSDVY